MTDYSLQEDNTPPRLFIGGTGRSGTTILYKVLGSHEAIYSFPKEMRFIVDPDGVVALTDALTTNYSAVQAREALFRFERLMRVDLNSPEWPPFLGYDMASLLGEEFYWERLNQFCDELQSLQYEVTSSRVEWKWGGKRKRLGRAIKQIGQRILNEREIPHRTTFNWPRFEAKVVNYFGDRSQLLNLSAEFVDDLFLSAAHRNGKATWCEKTPHNLYYIHFLQELFPNSVFIHIKRDPRGVLQSVMKQDWGPHTIQDTSRYLAQLYQRWFDYRAQLDLNERNYLELKLEDLANSTDEVLSKVTGVCRVRDKFHNLPNIRPEKVDNWRSAMTDDEKQLATTQLEPYIVEMGYDL